MRERERERKRERRGEERRGEGGREGEVTRRYGKVDLVGRHNEGRWHEKEKLHPVHLGSLPAG
jgi:hypothetical protein